MIRCPRCNTDNDDQRTICTKCGKYLYRQDGTRINGMTKKQRQDADRRIAKAKAKKIFKIVWIVLVIIVMSFWMVSLGTIISENLG